MRKLIFPPHSTRPFFHFLYAFRSFSFSSNLLAPVVRDRVRNIAVIAHVDHGKTTLVDAMLKQSGTLVNAHNRVMDSKDQEKERGITILAKNTAIVLDPTVFHLSAPSEASSSTPVVSLKESENSDKPPEAEGSTGSGIVSTSAGRLPDFDGQFRINIVDTPGHLDFSGEVERTLQMVEGFVLLVDAVEGVKPGTRYVLRKALGLGLRPVVCVNKIDKDSSRIDAVVEQIQDLFLDICEDVDQLDHINFLYGSGREGYMNETPITNGSLAPLFSKIYERVPAPTADSDDSLQFLVSQVGTNEEKGLKMLIGRVFKGSVAPGDIVSVLFEGKQVEALVKEIRLFVGVETVLVASAKFGDVCALYVKEPLSKRIPLIIGSTVCSREQLNPYPYKKPDEPTYSLRLRRTEAPWKGKEAADNMSIFPVVQKRLEAEAMVNSALRLEGLGTDIVTLQGRGPLHLSVLIEDMRREGYEFEVLSASVIMKTIDGVVCEPFERLSLEFSAAHMPPVTDLLSAKMGEMGAIDQLSGGRINVECVMPVRFMVHVPNLFNTITSGDGVLHHSFEGYRPCCGFADERLEGTLVSNCEGKVEPYSLTQLQNLGRFFVEPGDYIYPGQIVGENKTPLQNMAINITKKNEQLGGFRANVNDKAKRTVASYRAKRATFEDCMAWITDDELITVTPKSIRMRKPNFNGKTSMRQQKAKK